MPIFEWRVVILALIAALTHVATAIILRRREHRDGSS